MLIPKTFFLIGNRPAFIFVLVIFIVEFSLGTTTNNQINSNPTQFGMQSKYQGHSPDGVEIDDERANDYLVDERFPLVISNDYNDLQNDSLFGATVQLFKYKHTDHTWLFVGEPKGNASLENITYNEPGVIWKCGFYFRMAKTIRKDYCEMLFIDDVVQDSTNITRAVGQAWIGVSLSVIAGSGSQSTQLITCSHRKTPTSLYRGERISWMNGACYVLNVDQFSKTESMAPMIRSTKINVKISPGFAVPLYSALGMSLNVNQDQVFIGGPGYSQRNFIMNVPAASLQSRKYVIIQRRPNKSQSIQVQSAYYGYAVTSGNYFPNPYQRVNSSGKVNYFAGGCPRGNNLTGCVLISRTYEINGVFVQTINGYHIGSYFGSVLYSEDVDNDGLCDLLIGAPFTGQLSSGFYRNYPFITQEQDSMLKITAQRHQSSASLSSFRPTRSFTVESENSNDDQDSDGDLGVVYLYKYNSMTDDLQAVQVLTGGNSPFSRFGSAISSIEGFKVEPGAESKKYILIGAPYENENEGAIYFYDAQKLLTNRYYVKRISAGQLTSRFSSGKSFQGLGYSFSTTSASQASDDLDLDVDGNGTPDLAIGSCLSKDVVILRTRHQIQFKSQLITIARGDVEESDLTSFKLKKKDDKFELRVYVEVAVPQRIIDEKENLQIWSRITIDEGQLDKRYAILQQEKVKGPAQQVNKETIEFSSFLMNGSITNNRVRISKSFGVRRVKTFTLAEFPPAIKIHLRSWYNETAFNGLSPSRTDYSIIRDAQGQPNLTKLKSTHHNNATVDTDNNDDFRPYLPSPALSPISFFQVHFLPESCRNHSWCQPTLQISNVHFTTMQGHPLPKENSFELGTLPEILLKWTIENVNKDKEIALLPGAFIEYKLTQDNGSNGTQLNSTFLSLLSLRENSGCIPENSWFRCSMSDFIQANSSTTMAVRLRMSGINEERLKQSLSIQLTPTHAHSGLKPALNGQTASEEFQDLTKKVELKLLAPSEITTIN